MTCMVMVDQEGGGGVRETASLNLWRGRAERVGGAAISIFLGIPIPSGIDIYQAFLHTYLLGLHDADILSVTDRPMQAGRAWASAACYLIEIGIPTPAAAEHIAVLCLSAFTRCLRGMHADGWVIPPLFLPAAGEFSGD